MTILPNNQSVIQLSYQRAAASAVTATQAVRSTTSGNVQPAITNLRSIPFDGISLNSASTGQPVYVSAHGPLDPTTFNLGDGYACAVGTTVAGFPVRATDVTCVSAPNWLGHCDAHGNITIDPIRKDVFNALDFGADASGTIENNTIASQALIAIAALGGGTFYWPEGNYKFISRLGPLPSGTHLKGVLGATQFRFYGGTGVDGYGGVGISIGSRNDANVANGSIVEGIDIEGYLATGNSSYPNINEIGIEILGADATIRDCRLGGFKYQISLDGSEVCFIERIHFDGGGHGYTNMMTNLGDSSAFAIRMGSFKFLVPASANAIWVRGAQFNNSRFGLLHQDGLGQFIADCNFENCAAWGVIGAAKTVGYRNCEGEGASIANIYLHNSAGAATANQLSLEHCFFSASVPAVLLDNVALYGLSFRDNDCSGMTAVYPITGNTHLVGPVSLDGSTPPTSGPSADRLIDGDGTWTPVSGVAGFAINHGTIPQATIDAQMFDYTTPLLRVRERTTDYLELGAPGSHYGGNIQDFRRLLSINTGTQNTIIAKTIGRQEVLQSAAATKYFPLLVPDESSGIVIMRVSAAKLTDATKNASWEIWQSFHRSAGTLVLDGSPTGSKTIDNDGSFVAPTLKVRSTPDSVVAEITGHPTFVSVWSVSFDLQTTGQ